uniref:WGS project CAEQ00000000 data, annotated contig 129 n=1 Tax=Trypanosoma congolense (strain IL3000) TaxID=1068625 RepID=F9W598_TRYCI|nr:unnamed protein product [Trypanosoma congolense IL3000]
MWLGILFFPQLGLHTRSRWGMETLALLIGLMHRNASVSCRAKGLATLNRIFENIIDSPQVDKYKRISLTSVTWTNCIVPAFHVFQLIEWLVDLGFDNPDGRGVLLFKCDSFERISDASHSVCFLRSAYDNPPLKCDVKCPEPVEELLSLLRALVSQSDRDLPEGVNVASNSFSSSMVDSFWETLKNNLRVVVLGHQFRRRKQCYVKENTAQPLLPESCLALWTSLHDVAGQLNLLQLEECFTVVDTERFEFCETCAHSRRMCQCGHRATARKLVAERHKSVSNHDGSGHSGINHEIRVVATRLIVDISSCIEQISVLEEDQGMTRKDRLEARRLLTKFNEDGDIGYLHAQWEEWSTRLEDLKKEKGKSFVYLQQH